MLLFSSLDISINEHQAGYELATSTIPSYTVRESTRAKRIRLELSVDDGLLVVVPKGYDHGRIPALLEQRADWILKAYQRLRQKSAPRPQSLSVLPQQIALVALGEFWIVKYQAGNTSSVTLTEQPGNTLLVAGRIDNTQLCRGVLKQWLAHKAQKHMKPWLLSMAKAAGYSVSRVHIKAQRTRWGSCSNKKAISLNMALLLIPQELVRYVLFHELCHTVHMNHSSQFWALVGSHYKDYQSARKQLGSAWQSVPAWLHE